ncbi:unnamed protein product [Meloidogyne enterolobii]|uniref:Uncharacterized protein n=1 Tax=Meloidogyne enterolobii TaxID=390850 RepID=A0ACB0YLZ5_MELEN
MKLNLFVKGIAYGVYTFSALHLFAENVGCFILCQGDSMLPTLKDGDILWAKKLQPHQLSESTNKSFGCLNKGDIVCLKNPTDAEEQSVIKRIYKFIQKDRNSASSEIEIRGDNTFNSTDSRDYGPVPIGLIQYKAVYRLYPLERRGRIIEYN